MISQSRNDLRRLLISAVVYSTLVVLTISLVGTLWLSKVSNRQEQKYYNEEISKNAAALLNSSLSFSDFGEVQRILGLLTSKQGETFAVLTKSGDLLLADYQKRELFAPFLHLKKAQLNCSIISAELQHFKFKDQTFDTFCSEIYLRGLGQTQNSLGTVILVSSDSGFSMPLRRTILSLLLILFSLIGVVFILRLKINKLIVEPIEALMLNLETKAENPLIDTEGETEGKPERTAPTQIHEIDRLKIAFENLLHGFRSEHKKRTEIEQQMAREELALKVAHDIRSPLAALAVVIDDLGNSSTETQKLAKGAFNRIQAIAEDLLESNRNSKQDSALTLAVHQNMLDLNEEKKIEFKQFSNLKLHFESSVTANQKVKAEKAQLERILSNVLNNAAEACHYVGNIWIKLRKVTDNVIIEVEDEGVGMQPEVLHRVGEYGFSFGKASSLISGSGIAIHNAKLKLQEWGGDLKFFSQPNKGTVVTICLKSHN